MARGTVTVENLNLSQGDFPAIERKLLFIGVGANAANIGNVLSLNTGSDLDVLLGAGDSPLKTNLTAAMLNAGQNWFAWCLPVSATATADDCILAYQESADVYFRATSPEGVVCLRPAQSADELSGWQDAVMDQLARKGRQQFVILALPGVLATQTWSEYETALAAIVAPVAANRVMVVPQLHGNNVGVLAGRLCKRAVSIADTPMRVKTGALQGLGDSPVDADGQLLPESTLMALDAARISVPQHYADYPGIYWADANLLEVPAGDYQVIEYLRPVIKACREVRLLAIAKIGDKDFNDTPESIAYHKHYFARPLRSMSKTMQIEHDGETYTLTGDIMPPDNDSVTIQWESKTRVKLLVKVRPYSCPKDILAFVVLDLSLEA